MKRFKFSMGTAYVFYFGDTLGLAILAFLKHRPGLMHQVTAIDEEPVQDHERP